MYGRECGGWPTRTLHVRFVWDVGDLTNPTYNAPATVREDMSGSYGTSLIDLGRDSD